MPLSQQAGKCESDLRRFSENNLVQLQFDLLNICMHYIVLENGGRRDSGGENLALANSYKVRILPQALFWIQTSMKLLFVCLGNICRSPTAHAIFRQLAAARNFPCEVESAGTSASHKGAPPDPRSIKAASDVSFKGIYSRPVQNTDFDDYDLILAMDLENMAALKRRCPVEHQHKLKLLMSYHPDYARQPEVPDPYYGGIRGFDLVRQLIEVSCERLLAELQQKR